MKTSWVARARVLLFPPAADDHVEDRSVYQRLAIPFTFKPQLSLLEAFVAAATTFLRIFLGCLLFAVWGAYTLWAWSTIHSLFLRVSALLALAVMFLLSCLLMILVSSALARFLTPRRR